jgi:hypothetical protein
MFFFSFDFEAPTFLFWYSWSLLKTLKHSSRWRCAVSRRKVGLISVSFVFLRRSFVLLILKRKEEIFLVFSLFDRMLEKRSLSYVDGPIPVPFDDQFLFENVQRICVCDTGMGFCFFTCSISCFWSRGKEMKGLGS